METINYEFKNRLGYKLSRVGTLARRHLIVALESWDISPEQWMILSVIVAHKDGVFAKHICKATSMDRHSVSKILKKLEEHGWIKRTLDIENNRSEKIYPTQKVLTEHRKMTNHLDELAERIRSRLGSDWDKLDKILNTLTEFFS